MEKFFTNMHQVYLRLLDEKRFASNHPHMNYAEFSAIQKTIWKDIPSGHGPVEWIKMV